MTVEPAEGRSRRPIVVAAVAVMLAVIGWLAFGGLGSALIYYRTPTEVIALGEDAIGQRLRVGGLVKAGTLICYEGGEYSFTITDGQTELRVLGSTEFPRLSLQCPRENVGVVVQGQISTLGVFEPTEVIVKHDENYVAPTEGAIPTQAFDPGT
jgi:cytochrome c-type biogenesis protein CcmE